MHKFPMPGKLGAKIVILAMLAGFAGFGLVYIGTEVVENAVLETGGRILGIGGILAGLVGICVHWLSMLAAVDGRRGD